MMLSFLLLLMMMMTVHFTTATVMVETIDNTTRHLADKLVNKYGSQAHE